MTGVLYLVPTPIGNLKEISPRVIETLNSVDFIACEDTRNTNKLLQLIGISKPTVSCHEHNERESSKSIVQKILKGQNVAYVSDAGYPCISDPGSILVDECVKNDIKIIPLSGPNAFLNALVGSNLDASHFLFYGFLDAKESSREKELEKLKDLPYTILFYEAPHRAQDTINSLYKVLGNRKITVARELTKVYEEFIRTDLENLVKNPIEFRGELVFVVEKKIEEEDKDLSVYIDKVNELIKGGLSQRDAIQVVATIFKINKNKLYKETIKK